MRYLSDVHVFSFSCRVVQTFNEPFDLLGVLALEVESLSEVQMSLFDAA